MKHIISDDILRRVSKGAFLLDAIAPEWYIRINTTNLVMSLCRRCILGQLYGYYSRGLRIVFGHATLEQDIKFGFRPLVEEGEDWETIDYLYKIAWKNEINLRLAGGLGLSQRKLT